MINKLTGLPVSDETLEVLEGLKNNCAYPLEQIQTLSEIQESYSCINNSTSAHSLRDICEMYRNDRTSDPQQSELTEKMLWNVVCRNFPVIFQNAERRYDNLPCHIPPSFQSSVVLVLI